MASDIVFEWKTNAVFSKQIDINCSPEAHHARFVLSSLRVSKNVLCLSQDLRSLLCTAPFRVLSDLQMRRCENKNQPSFQLVTFGLHFSLHASCLYHCSSRMLEEEKKAQTWFKIIGKLVACCVTFIAILSTGTISKTAIFFMTWSMGQQLKGLSPEGQDRYTGENDATSEHLERFACWMWSLFFASAVPDMFAFLQSLHVCLSRSDCWNRPRFADFTIVFLLETAQAIGMGMLLGYILPCLPVVHGILISNCLYLVPALFNFLSRKADEPKRMVNMTMDGFAFLAQLSGCLYWVLIRGNANTLIKSYDTSFIHRRWMMDWMLPVSLILISLGWWENHVDKDAPVGFIKSLGRVKETLKKTRPFNQMFFSLWKTSIFLGTTLILADVAFMAQEGHTFGANFVSLFAVTKNGFIQFWWSAMALDWNSPFYICVIQSVASLLFYCFGTFACKIGVQRSCFAFPVILVTPSLISIWAVAQAELLKLCHDCFPNAVHYFIHDNHHLRIVWLVLASSWFLSQIWITLRIWKPAENSSEVEISNTKWYNSFVIDQSITLSPAHRPSTINIKTVDPKTSGIPHVFAVITMWHESTEEMMTILKSIFRLDKDQYERRVACDHTKVIDPHLYHYETHIFFDDAFESHSCDGIASRVVNQFVNDFIATVDKVTFERTSSNSLQPPTVSVTPYGGRLEWILPGKTKMAVHLKDKTKIRIKKRWSQVMYIDYLIRYEMANVADMCNVFLLSLDGDMDFRPKAVHILIDVMNAQPETGIACNRSHPTGSVGAMVWYQIFEYAAFLWLLKPSEDLLGSILCAPGCFCLMRASVLLDEEIMANFTALSEKAHHMIQRDQGEDRWLCTLLIKRAYRLSYSASSYAYTHCPETFDEFYNQRRRWALSLIANTLDVLWNSRQIVKLNPNISWLYIGFQAVLLAIGLLSPASIFLALVNASATTFFLNPWISLAVHSALIIIFVVTCFVAPTRIQLTVAKCLTALYGVILAAVLINRLIAMYHHSGAETSWSLHNVVFLFLTSFIFLAGCLHPREIHCLLAGPVYLLLTPSMSMLLLLYAVINMNVVSWGTRDSQSSETTKPSVTKTVAQDVKEIVAVSAMTPPMLEQDSQETPASITSAPVIRSTNDYNARVSLGWNLDTEVTLWKQLRNVKCLSEEENSYWNNLIARKLFPVLESTQHHKEKISTDLNRLRNLCFTCFFMLNSLFVVLMFGIQLNSDISIPPGLNNTGSSIHQNSKEFTRQEEGWLSQTDPVQICLVFVAGLMLVIQFTALLISRVGNLVRMFSSVQFTFFRRSPEATSNPNDSLPHQVGFNGYDLATYRNNENPVSDHDTDLRQITAISRL